MNIFYSNLLKAVSVIILLMCCNKNVNQGTSQSLNDFAVDNLALASGQIDLQLQVAIEKQRIPRTQHEDGSIQFTHNGNFDWTEGFFPGTCWYLYSFTGDEKYRNAAETLQDLIKDHRFLTTNHDLGFVFNCSYGAGYRITKNEDFKQILLDAANSLIQRYNPTVGCILSWNVDRGWQSSRGWLFPVIIDNMMNLELLFEASEITGDPIYRDIAISHANTTLKNHFRDDFSSYHVIDYNPQTGAVRSKQTAQGYAHESAWARGQAWGLYGYTICYRYTKDPAYLEAAEKIANFILSNPNMPEDLVPYWDYNSPKIPNDFRDVSAAAITASALIELVEYSERDYLKSAKAILRSLSSATYKADQGTNNHFILKHSVGSIPHGAEIDVPLVYADYYYVESLIRLHKSEIKNQEVFVSGISVK
ncbi:MAG: glycoside hydrolase family 88 protein [Cytophagales bacterium]|nr:glycoside hydrolase family 88 protein [Cytophagales bacterium]